jgi:hypothetical protein
VPKAPRKAAQGAENLSPGGLYAFGGFRIWELNNFPCSKKLRRKNELRKLRNQKVETPFDGTIHRGASSLIQPDSPTGELILALLFFPWNRELSGDPPL